MNTLMTVIVLLISIESTCFAMDEEANPTYDSCVRSCQTGHYTQNPDGSYGIPVPIKDDRYNACIQACKSARHALIKTMRTMHKIAKAQGSTP